MPAGKSSSLKQRGVSSGTTKVGKATWFQAVINSKKPRLWDATVTTCERNSNKIIFNISYYDHNVDLLLSQLSMMRCSRLSNTT